MKYATTLRMHCIDTKALVFMFNGGSSSSNFHQDLHAIAVKVGAGGLKLQWTRCDALHTHTHVCKRKEPV